MSDSLYDDDILLWSEQQAEIIRRLGRAPRTAPNDLDIENVAEEIESVGRSELAAVRSRIRLILVHLIKLAIDPDSQAARHWRSEIVGFHAELADRYAPSMRQRIDMDELWRSAREQAVFDSAIAERLLGGGLPTSAPFELGDFLLSHIDSAGLAQRIVQGLPRPDLDHP